MRAATMLKAFVVVALGAMAYPPLLRVSCVAVDDRHGRAFIAALLLLGIAGAVESILKGGRDALR